MSNSEPFLIAFFYNIFPFTCQAALQGGHAQTYFLTEGFLHEFLRVSTHPRVFERPLTWTEALRFLKPLLTFHRFQILVAGEDQRTIFEKILEELVRPSGNLFFDIRTVAMMREHGVREIYTTDTDFLQFRGLQVINPLKWTFYIGSDIEFQRQQIEKLILYNQKLPEA